jgi:FkbM family methyltransferase
LVLVDALPKCVELAKKKYEFFPNTKVLNCAVSTDNGWTNIYFPKGQDTHPHASLSEEHVIKHEHDEVESVGVPSMTINQILEMFPATDRVYMDLEGMDIDILFDWDFGRFKPFFIQYEFHHSEGTFTHGQGSKFRESARLLMDVGYSLTPHKEYDMIAKLR